MPTFSAPSLLFNFCVALGIGLLVGAERERRKGEGPLRRSAGIRTFAACALTGFVAQSLGGTYLLITTLLILGTLTGLSYQQSKEHDPGLTSEVSILLTCLLGALSVQTPDLAALIGIVLTAMLAARERMHQFVRQIITEQEMEDVIVFLAAALIFLPLAPNQHIGPYQSINPHDLARFVVTVMSISAAGHMAKRTMGPHASMALTGFAGGFISSTATILVMGQAARHSPQHVQLAATGAMLSTVSTLLQLGVLVSVLVPEMLPHMLMPMGLGGVVAGLYTLWMDRRSTLADPLPPMDLKGHAFDHKTTLLLCLAVLSITVLTAALHQWLGSQGVMIAAMLAGLVDAHSTVASTSSLVTQELMTLTQAQQAIFLAVSTNTFSKAAVAISAGGRSFALRVVPGLTLVIAAVWLGAWLTA
jgi:uncharacterized membrane protein (DUF4010 family)